MDDDSQPRLVILGAGPIGLEAALYARYLGYSAEVFGRGKLPALSIHDAGERMLDGPFREHASTLGVAALAAQNSKWQCPAGSTILTAAEYYHSYLAPLAESDLIADSLRLGMEVQCVNRSEVDTWQISCCSQTGYESAFAADALIDTTGAGSACFFRGEAGDEEDQSPESLSFLNPVADYYVLGSKSSKPGEFFRFTEGLAQIRELFAILGEREDLDVYATMPPIAG